jgi:hypothetical protein
LRDCAFLIAGDGVTDPWDGGPGLQILNHQNCEIVCKR